MAKKKIIRVEDITEKDILSLYETVLPFLIHNPGKVDPMKKLREALQRLVEFDSFHYLMVDPDQHLKDAKHSVLFERWGSTKEQTDFTSIFVQEKQDIKGEDIFTKQAKENFRSLVKLVSPRFPGKPNVQHFTIRSEKKPKLLVGFIRFEGKEEDRSFTKKDKKIFEKLKPHLLILFPIVLSPLFHSSTFQHYDGYIYTLSKIVSEHDLSDSEAKLLPQILFGYSNKEIADKTFISVSTVKKHIQHIFKKTGVKSRIEFISHFFTSPERVELP